MNELLKLIFGFNIKGLFVVPTYNITIQIFRAMFVGVIALTADAGLLYAVSLTGLHYLICAVFGFLAGVYVNYMLSVRFVFKEKAAISVYGEIMVYIIVGSVGLLLTVGLMWFFTEVIGLFFMVSKFIAAVLVFAWNFTSRKVALYRNRLD
jgi:putative flippase GtrA